MQKHANKVMTVQTSEEMKCSKIDRNYLAGGVKIWRLLEHKNAQCCKSRNHYDFST